MPVKNIKSGEVHVGTKGGRTGCGENTNTNPDHWVASSGQITCAKNGCKN